MLLLRSTLLFFRLQFAVIFSDERFDIRGTGKNSKPLFLVKSDRETPPSHKEKRRPSR